MSWKIRQESRPQPGLGPKALASLGPLSEALTRPMPLFEDEMDAQYVGPDEYRGIIGRCPATWNVNDDGKGCHQVRPGPKKLRIGDLPAEERDKIKATKKAGAGEAPKDGEGKHADLKAAIKAGKPEKKKLDLPDNPLTKEETVAPPGGAEAHNPDPEKTNEDGLTEAARVGICGKCMAPPKKVPRLPNMTADERDVETRFADAFEKDPDGMVAEYRQMLKDRKIGDAANVYSTDDAKVLSPDYNPGPGASVEERNEAMGRYNVVVHQTSNAIAKRAFMQHLDELAKLPKDDPKRSVLVTNGGVAAGKGYALTNVEETKSIADQVGAVWDSAGEQNGTESPWVIEECKKRGLKTTMVFVDSDPKETWENPKRGVVERAKKKGRMVDARVFADSYAIGAKNFDALHKKHKDDKDVDFVIINSRGKTPTRVESVSDEAKGLDADAVYERSLKAIHGMEGVPPAVKRGGTIGQRIWQ